MIWNPNIGWKELFNELRAQGFTPYEIAECVEDWMSQPFPEPRHNV